MIHIKQILDNEAKEDGIYPDECVASNLYYTSFSKSMRAIEGTRKEDQETDNKRNNWLVDRIRCARNIFAISIDNLVNKLGNYETIIDSIPSCDSLLLNMYNKEDGRELHLLIEFKNVSRRKVLEFLKTDDINKDSIIRKCKGTAKILEEMVWFNQVGDGKIVKENSHFVIVYSGPADTVQEIRDGIERDARYDNQRDIKEIVDSENNGMSPGRRKKALNMRRKAPSPGNKINKELVERFSREVKKCGYAQCTKSYFSGFPGEPKSERKGREEYRDFSLMTVSDLGKLADEGFFDKMIKDYRAWYEEDI